MLDLYELQVFLIAAELENFSETARMLDISQPAVSGHIQSLEHRLNTQLFDRVGRHIRLNDAGAALVPSVRGLLKEAERVEEIVAARQGALVGLVKLGCSTTSGKYVLPGIMHRFFQDHPEVKIYCIVGQRGDALERLETNEVDIALSSLRIPRRNLEYRHFAEDEISLIAPPDHVWARMGTIGLEDLCDFPIILRESTSGTTVTLNRGLAQHDMSVEMLRSNLTLCNTESIVQAVISGIGPAFVSDVSARAAIAAGQVVRVEVEGLKLVQHLYMVRHTGYRPSEAQQMFWEFLFAPENADLRSALAREG